MHNKLPAGNCYRENMIAFARLCADAKDQEAVCTFLAEQRIRQQSEPVVSMEYMNAAGRKSTGAYAYQYGDQGGRCKKLHDCLSGYLYRIEAAA